MKPKTKTPDYCTQNNGECQTCALVSYGRDCRNNPIPSPRGPKRLPPDQKAKATWMIRLAPRDFQALAHLAGQCSAYYCRTVYPAEAARLLLLDQLAGIDPSPMPTQRGRPPVENKTKSITLSVNTQQRERIEHLRYSHNYKTISEMFRDKLKTCGG